jgi:capsular polysaccharide transport system permease protein
MFAIFWIYDIDFMPRDTVQAALALMANMLLGLGLGVLNAPIAAAIPFWMVGYSLLIIVSWMASGVLFVPDAMPEPARTYLSYVPMLQGIEWMRSAYYQGFGEGILDRGYLISFGIVSLFIGLALERLVRGKMLQ